MRSAMTSEEFPAAPETLFPISQLSFRVRNRFFGTRWRRNGVDRAEIKIGTRADVARRSEDVLSITRQFHQLADRGETEKRRPM